MPPPHDSSTCSSLDRLKDNAVAPQDDKHYSPLQPKRMTEHGQSVPPHNGQDIGGQYGKLVEDKSIPHPSSEECARVVIMKERKTTTVIKLQYNRHTTHNRT